MVNMAYSRRSSRRLARKSRTNFIISLILIGVLLYATIQWFLPFLIGGIGFIKGIIKPSHKTTSSLSQDASLAPPVLNIPFEATSTAKINITGYGTPNSKVAIYFDDEKKDTQDVSEDGSFVFKNIPLVLGTNNIYGKSLDPASGGVNDQDKESLPSKTFKVIYDNEKPTLNINEPEDGKTIHGGDKKIKVSGKTEAGAQVFINDSQIIVDKDGNFSSEESLNEGDNNFNIKSLDKALNQTETSRKVIYQP